MAYIGNDLAVAYPSYRNIDDISASFNGSTTSFALLVNGTAPVPQPLNSQQCLISVGGVLQRPDDTGSEGFRLSGGNIIFSSAPSISEDFFGVVLAGADYVNVGANFPDGQVGAPSITFDQDTDTGFYRSGSGAVSFTSNGVGTATFGSASFIAPSFIPTSSTVPTNGVYLPAANSVAISTNSTERTRIDSSGRLLVGTSTARTDFFNGGFGARVLSERAGGLNGSYAHYAAVNNENNDEGAIILLGKSRGTTLGSATVVQSGDALGTIEFEGADGTDLVPAARIQAFVDGTPGNNDLPCRLVFSTTADGAASPTERMRIDSTGRTLIGTTAPILSSASLLQVSTTANAALFSTTNTAADVLGLLNAATTGNNIFVSFGTEAGFTSRGTIDYNRAAGQVRYNVTSDRRLKSDIQDAGSALSILNQIKVRSYTWAETGYGVEYGFIAQELNEAVPDAVKVGDDGDEVVDTWAVDNAKLVPVLTKALQEAIAEITSLKDRLTAAGL